MSGIFDGVRGAQFPDVVMNSGPLPPTGGLPAPLHDTADGKINYNSTLLGDLQPYAYGEGAYLSTQQSYMNIPHRIQKILPVIYLPEPDGLSTFRLSHSVDDGDVAFSMRLDKQSLFCTNLKQASKRQSLGTAIDPFINLPTLNYILAGIQLHLSINDQGEMRPNSLWHSLLLSLDRTRFNEHRNYNVDILTLMDLVHIIRSCIRPFGIVRGSEKQGGQNEMTESPATWPVPFVVTMVLDGKEDHVVNMWNHLDVSAGEDLVLHLKPMPLKKYTLNHYYKHPTYKNFDALCGDHKVVWQLVPDKFSLDSSIPELYEHVIDHPLSAQWCIWGLPLKLQLKDAYSNENVLSAAQFISALDVNWQELGYWHIGRTQMRMNKYSLDDTCYYHNDMVNGLHSQYMMLTFEPVFNKYDFFMIPEKDVNPGITEVFQRQRTRNRRPRQENLVISSKLQNVQTNMLNSMMDTPIGTQKRLALSEWELVSSDAAPATPSVSLVVDGAPSTMTEEPVSTQQAPNKTGVVKRRKIQETVKLNTDGTVEKQDAVTL